MASKNQKRFSTSDSVQVKDHDLRAGSPHSNGAGVMVGENREHFSLLQNGRQQRPRNYTKPVRVSSMVAGNEQNSSDEGDNDSISEDRASLVSVVVKNRMASSLRLMRSRFPNGRGVLLVFIICFLETFSFIGALTGVKQLLPIKYKCQGCLIDLESFVLSLLYSSAGRVFYPVAGVIADSYIGRYNVIHIGLWLLWIGFAISMLAYSILLSIPHGLAGKVFKYVVAIVSVVLFSAGSGSVEATVIPFGVDQLSPGASSDEISSYFYYYYIVRNIAGLIATCILFVVFDVASFFPHSDDSIDSKAYNWNMDIDYIVQNFLALLAVTAALLVLFHFRNHFHRDKQHSNALYSVTRVLYFAARVKRQIPQRNRAFRYGGAKTPRIDLAKTENDGDFSGEEVEEVKTFYRMLLLILSLFGYFITYGAVSKSLCMIKL
jgi:MFS family permease